MTNFEIFKQQLDDSLLNELLNGGKIIYRYLLKEKGFVLIERDEPITHKNGLSYKYVSYKYSPTLHGFYAACEFMKSKGEATKSVIRRALNNFYNRD